eukprot:scaffold903_cov262-Pinguiococcus_pyrenoidosus.AAC.21
MPALPSPQHTTARTTPGLLVDASTNDARHTVIRRPLMYLCTLPSVWETSTTAPVWQEGMCVEHEARVAAQDNAQVEELQQRILLVEHVVPNAKAKVEHSARQNSSQHLLRLLGQAVEQIDGQAAQEGLFIRFHQQKQRRNAQHDRIEGCQEDCARPVHGCGEAQRRSWPTNELRDRANDSVESCTKGWGREAQKIPSESAGNSTSSAS